MGITEEVSTSKFHLLTALGEKKKAMAVADSLVASDPTSAHLQLVRAELVSSTGDKKKAEKLVKEVQKKFPEERLLTYRQLAILYVEQGKNAQAADLLKELIASPKVDFASKQALLMGAAGDSALGRYFGEDDFKALLKASPGEAGAYLCYAEYLMGKRDTRAFSLLEQAVDIDPGSDGAWLALLDYYQKTDTVKFNSSLEKAYGSNPDNAMILFYKAGQDMNRGRKKEAVEKWTRAAEVLKQKTGENVRVSMLYGQIGDVHMLEAEQTHDPGTEALAFAAYDTALVYDSHNIGVLNNYAYYLAEKGVELERAERMSGITVQADPSSPTFLDTYAWIYYKMGRISTARLYIEQAISNIKDANSDATLMEHYGDILYADGDTKEAAVQWKNALKAAKQPSEALKRKAETGEMQNKGN